ncbi:heme-degrading domain-containing protein [Microbacterium sp. STN6]|uniref:heme-degrading domain-containing protein n=1 Tax=Microbacterium sp. STN6 TaxID=2995588 RepID=UPI0022608920|nr:heme-degrading domain-containing protein [Microbacterium sp. STN6]MCX7521759.1 heme-degrading domain-containing protein [Microbacterium sp. STN6]
MSGTRGGQDGLEELLEQELQLQFDSFTHDDAWSIGMRLVQLASDRSLPVAIAVMLGDQRAFHAGLAGASADNDAWLERKFRVVRRFGHSSLAVGEQYRARGGDFDTDSRLDTDLYAAHGGAFPILVRGAIVGVAGVSGLAQRDDHALVVEALEAHRDDIRDAKARRRRRAAGGE